MKYEVMAVSAVGVAVSDIRDSSGSKWEQNFSAVSFKLYFGIVKFPKSLLLQYKFNFMVHKAWQNIILLWFKEV